jgi:cob(I)alamin adenosyltransferase
MKIYSKSGDRGSTRLANGKKVSKSSLQVRSYGEVDELSSHLGLLSEQIKNNSNILSEIFNIQINLYFLGAELAGLPLKSLKSPVSLEDVSFLEKSIDEMSSALPELRNFVVPGGCLLNSYAHVARTVCRRAERSVVELSSQQTLRAECVIYMNRLSDWLFVLARFLSFKSGAEEKIIS